MNDTIIAALIGGSTVLAGMIIDRIFFFLTERYRAKKDFFNNFFPARLEAHKKILGALYKSGSSYVNPKPIKQATMEETIKNFGKEIEDIFLETILIAEKQVTVDLLELSILISETLEIVNVPEKEDLLFDSLEKIQEKKTSLMLLLRKKSGVYILDKEFTMLTNK